MSSPERLRVATFPDGSQILVTEWTERDPTMERWAWPKRATVAVRPHRTATWGPPVALEDVE